MVRFRQTRASCGVELVKPNVVQLDPYCQWSFNEIQRNHSSLLPAKSSDQVADIDPFATVLFSDVRPSLFEMRYLAARLAFRLAWLSFLGLHVPGLSLTGTVCILLLLSHHHISSTSQLSDLTMWEKLYRDVIVSSDNQHSTDHPSSMRHPL